MAFYIDSRVAPVASVDSIGKGDGLPPPSTVSMKHKDTGGAMEEMADFDLEKLFRGELGPNVAEEIAAK